MRALVELGRPKVNLTLRVLGRRPDGFHELESLVAFAGGIADEVAFEPGADLAACVTGPFAGGIAGENLVLTALRLLADREPRLTLGAIRLEKRLPVAAGIGGGSADAAAVIRAVRRANAELEARVDWYAIARRLGADVPVCVLNRAAIMRGIGGKLEPIAALPPLPAVLVNPMVPVPAGKTAEVFRRLAAPPLRKTVTQETPAATPGSFTSRDDLMRFLRSVGNDLTGPATSVVPEIGGVLAALEEAPGALLARLSGAGPTCFAVFETPEAAQAAATRIKSAHPTWWAATVVLQ